MSKATKCQLCGKEVFLMEQLKLPKGQLLHRNCFKCATCGGFLKVGFYVIEDGKYHCKACNDKKKPPVVIDAAATITPVKPEANEKKQAAPAAAEAAPEPAAEPAPSEAAPTSEPAPAAAEPEPAQS